MSFEDVPSFSLARGYNSWDSIDVKNNMMLNPEELQAVQEGRPVPVVLGRTECIVVREDVFDRVQSLPGDGLDADTVYDLIQKVMAEDDANDPLLAGYQRYKRCPTLT